MYKYKNKKCLLILAENRCANSALKLNYTVNTDIFSSEKCKLAKCVNCDKLVEYCVLHSTCCKINVYLAFQIPLDLGN